MTIKTKKAHHIVNTLYDEGIVTSANSKDVLLEIIDSIIEAGYIIMSRSDLPTCDIDESGTFVMDKSLILKQLNQTLAQMIAYNKKQKSASIDKKIISLVDKIIDLSC